MHNGQLQKDPWVPRRVTSVAEVEARCELVEKLVELRHREHIVSYQRLLAREADIAAANDRLVARNKKAKKARRRSRRIEAGAAPLATVSDVLGIGRALRERTR
jgi:hypothetical protein